MSPPGLHARRRVKPVIEVKEIGRVGAVLAGTEKCQRLRDLGSSVSGAEANSDWSGTTNVSARICVASGLGFGGLLR